MRVPLGKTSDCNVIWMEGVRLDSVIFGMWEMSTDVSTLQWDYLCYHGVYQKRRRRRNSWGLSFLHSHKKHFLCRVNWSKNCYFQFSTLKEKKMLCNKRRTKNINFKFADHGISTSIQIYIETTLGSFSLMHCNEKHDFVFVTMHWYSKF